MGTEEEVMDLPEAFTSLLSRIQHLVDDSDGAELVSASPSLNEDRASTVSHILDTKRAA